VASTIAVVASEEMHAAGRKNLSAPVALWSVSVTRTRPVVPVSDSPRTWCSCRGCRIGSGAGGLTWIPEIGFVLACADEPNSNLRGQREAGYACITDRDRIGVVAYCQLAQVVTEQAAMALREYNAMGQNGMLSASEVGDRLQLPRVVVLWKRSHLRRGRNP
jgi:hypothetical protein